MALYGLRTSDTAAFHRKNVGSIFLWRIPNEGKEGATCGPVRAYMYDMPVTCSTGRPVPEHEIAEYLDLRLFVCNMPCLSNYICGVSFNNVFINQSPNKWKPNFKRLVLNRNRVPGSYEHWRENWNSRGLTDTPFESICATHKQSFNKSANKEQTELGKHIWELNQNKKNFQLPWEYTWQRSGLQAFKADKKMRTLYIRKVFYFC